MTPLRRFVHRAFDLSLLAKGAHAILECVGGVLLAIIPAATIVRGIQILTLDELNEDPNDLVARTLLRFAQGFSVSTEHFYAFYLLSHGIVKLALVVALLRGRLWAYPAALVVLTLFILYQLYRYSYTHSPGLIALSAFDVIVLALIWAEYRAVRHRA